MARIPETPEEVFEDFRCEYEEVLGDELRSVILYGSAARGEYVRGLSDINFLMVVTSNGLRRLGQCFGLVERWSKRAVAVPLFMTKEYIASSLDTFPIEFINMQRYHKTIRGNDVLADLKFDKNDLRLQIERETKGKALQLWQSYLTAGQDKKTLYELILASMTSMTSIFVGLLFLKDQQIPQRSTDVVDATAELLELDRGLFRKLVALRTEEWKGYRTQLVEMMEAYIREIERLYKIVDAL